jgi:hypothetical protein
MGIADTQTVGTRLYPFHPSLGCTIHSLTPRTVSGLSQIVIRGWYILHITTYRGYDMNSSPVASYIDRYERGAFGFGDACVNM